MELNKCMFIGTVKGTPVINDNQGQKSAQLVLTVIDRTPGANGQWVKKPMDILIYTTESKRANVIQQYVKPNQELYIEAVYINWQDANGAQKHAFRLISISLGYTPRTNTDSNTAESSFPPGM